MIRITQITEVDLSTEQAAAILHLRPQTLRKAYSQEGAYFGVRPRKAANRRLFWNANEICALIADGRACNDL